MIIKNFESLAKTPQRKIVLELIEEALSSIQPEKVLKEVMSLDNDVLKIKDQEFNLKNFEKVFLIGFGKGSAKISKHIEELLGETLTRGFVIDAEGESFEKIEFTQGTHPLPSLQNMQFTQGLLEKLNDLSEKDLVLIIVCGGGSAMLVAPQIAVTIDDKIGVSKQLLKSGATISEMNVVRKHLSKVKGGGLAKNLYPAKILSLIFSDVPGNDFSVIASGPTVKDESTVQDAKLIIDKYHIDHQATQRLVETPKDNKYFANVSNILMLSNRTALAAMQTKAGELGISARIYSDSFQNDAKDAGSKLINEAKSGEILLTGGETTVHVTGTGTGGRNQEVVLGALSDLAIEQWNNLVIASFDSDGWDNSEAAGAIGDSLTLEEAKKQNLNPEEYLKDNNSLPFFQKTGNAIITGRLPSNISDLIIVYRY